MLGKVCAVTENSLSQRLMWGCMGKGCIREGHLVASRQVQTRVMPAGMASNRSCKLRSILSEHRWDAATL